MIFTSTALRAGAILVYLTIYPSEMILFSFLRVLGSGMTSKACIIYGGISIFYLTDGAF